MNQRWWRIELTRARARMKVYVAFPSSWTMCYWKPTSVVSKRNYLTEKPTLSLKSISNHKYTLYKISDRGEDSDHFRLCG